MKKVEAIAYYREITQGDEATAINKLAEDLSISRHAIYQWDEEVPERRALKLEHLTRGKLKADSQRKQV
jgi:hypothetical protein